jgi:hypothetical protein
LYFRFGIVDITTTNRLLEIIPYRTEERRVTAYLWSAPIEPGTFGVFKYLRRFLYQSCGVTVFKISFHTPQSKFSKLKKVTGHWQTLPLLRYRLYSRAVSFKNAVIYVFCFYFILFYLNIKIGIKDMQCKFSLSLSTYLFSTEKTLSSVFSLEVRILLYSVKFCCVLSWDCCMWVRRKKNLELCVRKKTTLCAGIVHGKSFFVVLAQFGRVGDINCYYYTYF